MQRWYQVRTTAADNRNNLHKGHGLLGWLGRVDDFLPISVELQFFEQSWSKFPEVIATAALVE